MAIPKAYKANYNTLIKAVRHNQVALVECTDAVSGKLVYTLCAMSWDGQMFNTIPLAKLFDGNPYEELKPPTVEEEYESKSI